MAHQLLTSLVYLVNTDGIGSVDNDISLGIISKPSEIIMRNGKIIIRALE
jgi:hypothetical protein